MLQNNRRETSRPFDIVAIGASAGGVEAILALLAQFPSDLPASVLIVLHRSIERASHLRQILAGKCKLRFLVPKEGMPLEHGVCYVGESNIHLTVDPHCCLHLLPDHYYRAHNIDLLFSSLAQHAGSRTIGVILSGMLKDGSFGLRAIKKAGGMALVQSPEEATFREMPLSAIKYDGPIDLIAPIDDLVAEIYRLTGYLPNGANDLVEKIPD